MCAGQNKENSLVDKKNECLPIGRCFAITLPIVKTLKRTWKLSLLSYWMVNTKWKIVSCCLLMAMTILFMTVSLIKHTAYRLWTDLFLLIIAYHGRSPTHSQPTTRRRMAFPLVVESNFTSTASWSTRSKEILDPPTRFPFSLEPLQVNPLPV